jgi:hypothetical protein
MSRLSSVLGVLYIHAIVVMRRIVLGQFCVLFYCIGVLFLIVCYGCACVYVWTMLDDRE